MCSRNVPCSQLPHTNSEKAREQCINDMLLFWISECHQVVPKVLHFILSEWGLVFRSIHARNEFHAVEMLSHHCKNHSRLPSICCICAMHLYGITNGYSLSHPYYHGCCTRFAQKANFLYLNRATQQTSTIYSLQCCSPLLCFYCCKEEIKYMQNLCILPDHDHMIIIIIMLTMNWNAHWLTSPSERIRLKIAAYTLNE